MAATPPRRERLERASQVRVHLEPPLQLHRNGLSLRALGHLHARALEGDGLLDEAQGDRTPGERVVERAKLHPSSDARVGPSALERAVMVEECAALEEAQPGERFAFFSAISRARSSGSASLNAACSCSRLLGFFRYASSAALSFTRSSEAMCFSDSARVGVSLFAFDALFALAMVINISSRPSSRRRPRGWTIGPSMRARGDAATGDQACQLRTSARQVDPAPWRSIREKRNPKPPRRPPRAS